MSKVKIGIIGAGSLSTFHIDAYRNNPITEVVAICDSFGNRASQKAMELGIKEAYEDYDEMFRKCDIDAVSIITSNNTHASIAIAALNAGKHVLCEKPPALNAADAIRMKEAADRNKKLLMFGFVRRFAQNTEVLNDYIKRGEFGDIYYVKTGFLRRCGNPGGWFANRSISGGGPLIDLGVHIIDLAIYLMGKPKPVKVFGNTSNKLGNRANIKGVSGYKAADFDSSKNDVEDFANALIKFDNGASLFIETSWAMNIKADMLYMDLFGDKGGAKLEPDFEIYSEKNDYMVDIKPVMNSYSFDFNKSFGAEIDHFIDCIANGTPCMCPAEDGVTIMKILDAIYESSKTGEAIDL